jgi:hypothetical protein
MTTQQRSTRPQITTGQEPPRRRPPAADVTVPEAPGVQPLGPSRLQVARAVGVVFGGPLLLDALELLGPVSALGRWPERVPAGRIRSLGRRLTVAGVVAPFVDHLLVRPWLRRWGSSPAERDRRLPGDPAATPLFRATRAVTIHAPAEEVWRWLVQIGQDRGGFYTYDWLENLAGCRLRSAEEIREEWQQRATGDALTMFPGFATTFKEVAAPYALVIANWGAYVIEPVDGSTCRLIARSNTERNGAALFYLLLVELPHAIMERRMLIGIKQRAERSHRPTQDERSC